MTKQWNDKNQDKIREFRKILSLRTRKYKSMLKNLNNLKEWKNKNPEKMKEYRKNWRENNP